MFPASLREDLVRSLMGLQVVFSRKGFSESAGGAAAFSALESGIVALLTSAGTALLSASSRKRWADGLVADAQAVTPDLYDLARRFSR